MWPHRFVVTQRRVPDDGSGNATVTTFYDYEAGANLIQDAPDANMTDVLWDLELNNHHSYYFHPARRTCYKIHFPVGILRPDWLSNSTFLGPKTVLGRQVLAPPPPPPTLSLPPYTPRPPKLSSAARYSPGPRWISLTTMRTLRRVHLLHGISTP